MDQGSGEPGQPEVLTLLTPAKRRCQRPWDWPKKPLDVELPDMAERAVVFGERLDLILDVFSNLNDSLKAHRLDTSLSEMSPGWPGRTGSWDGQDGRGGSRDGRERSRDRRGGSRDGRGGSRAAQSCLLSRCKAAHLS